MTACKEPTPAPKSPAPAEGAAAEAGLPDHDPKIARKLVREQGALLLDVRTPEEFAEGHVEGARNIPVDEVASRIDEIEKLAGGDRTRPIVVYCRSGRRAAKAKATLLEHGFTKVSNLGGLADWCEDC